MSWSTPSIPGNTLLTAADANGDLAAYAVAVVDALFQPRARQYGPTVHPNHRGRRPGRWINAALIQRLREVHPYVNEIETTAAEDEPHQLAIREHLGFRFLRRTHIYELTPAVKRGVQVGSAASRSWAVPWRRDQTVSCSASAVAVASMPATGP